MVLCTTEINIAQTVSKSDIADLLTNAAWAIFSIYHTVLKASQGTATFGQDMLFDMPLIADWNKAMPNGSQHCLWKQNLVEWDYKMDDKVLGKKMVFSIN